MGSFRKGRPYAGEYRLIKCPSCDDLFSPEGIKMHFKQAHTLEFARNGYADIEQMGVEMKKSRFREIEKPEERLTIQSARKIPAQENDAMKHARTRVYEEEEEEEDFECESCGAGLKEGQKFCNECGKELDWKV